MNNLREIEEKLNLENEEKRQINENLILEQNTSVKQYELKNKKEPESFWTILLKFSKIISFATYQFLKKHKLFFIILVLLWMLAFRKRFKNKIFSLLKIVKF